MKNTQLETYYKDVNDHLRDFDLELARKRAFHIRYKAIDHLDKHLIDFETHFSKNQGKILWAPNAESGKQELLQVTGRSNRVHSQQHELLDELGMLDQAPSNWHFFDSAYFRYKKNRPAFTRDDAEAEKETLPRREVPSPEDIAVLFPRFYISENGSLLLADNDPYVELLLSTCKRLVFVIGIEQLCAGMSDSENLLSLMVRAGYGKKDFSSVHFVYGNKGVKEQSGQQETWVLMLDNGRTDLLAHIPQRQALYCIHCGACSRFSNKLPLNKDLDSIIDTIKAPFVKHPRHFEDNFNLTLSGRTTEICPVGIDLKGLVLENRKQAVEQKQEGRSDGYAWKAWKTAMMSRKWLNKNSGMKNFTLKSFFKKAWGEKREFPKVTDRSFNEWWIENKGKTEI